MPVPPRIFGRHLDLPGRKERSHAEFSFAEAALQSSVSSYSISRTLAEDAKGGSNEYLPTATVFTQRRSGIPGGGWIWGTRSLSTRW